MGKKRIRRDLRATVSLLLVTVMLFGLSGQIASAFKNCIDLESIRIPSGVTKIEDAAFQGCAKLKSAWIPASVEEIGQDLFTDCNPGFAIYGELGTAAERYAAEHDFLP